MPLNKKTRFDVFKRDSFTCQYCGRIPPTVILEIDHINPKSNGGKENVNNYITACFDCNRGKGKHKLTEVPPQMEEKVAELKERRAQLKAYNRFIEEQENYYNEAIERIDNIFSESFHGYELKPRFCSGTLRRFLKSLPLPQIEHAMSRSCSQMKNPDRAIPYFCGICWNWIKDPDTRDW